MVTFFVIVGAFFAFMAAWDLKDWWENREFEKKLEKYKDDTSLDDFFNEIADLPAPWIGMDESDLQNCNWYTWYDNCLETTNQLGTERSYYYVNRGWLLFRNNKLVNIQEFV
jgi:hypothetical protein